MTQQTGNCLEYTFERTLWRVSYFRYLYIVAHFRSPSSSHQSWMKPAWSLVKLENHSTWYQSISMVEEPAYGSSLSLNIPISSGELMIYPSSASDAFFKPVARFVANRVIPSAPPPSPDFEHNSDDAQRDQPYDIHNFSFQGIVGGQTPGYRNLQPANHRRNAAQKSNSA